MDIETYATSIKNKIEMDYKGIFDKFEEMSVMIIGDVMIDSYLWGKVERISPEAPVPICAVERKDNRLGGAGNVALNICAMGAKPIICSVVGNDAGKDDLFALMDKENMSKDNIIISPERLTTIKTRIIGNNCQMLRIDSELCSPISSDMERELISTIFSTLEREKIDAIIFQDYDKGVITEQIIKQVIRKAREMNIPICTDPKYRNFSLYKGVTLFKPNLKEMKDGLKIENFKPTLSNLESAALMLHEKQDIEKVFITLGEYGVFIADYGSKTPDRTRLIPARHRNIVDVSGAGDSVISVASLCTAAGMDSITMAMIGNLAGGLVCENVGVVPIDKQRLYREVIAM